MIVVIKTAIEEASPGPVESVFRDFEGLNWGMKEKTSN
jgi:hypothetical protein